MNRKFLIYSLSYLIFVTSFDSVEAQQPQVVLEDSFNYTGWNTGSTPMSAVWSANSGNFASIVTNNPTLSPSYISINNGVIGTRLSRTLTTDWTLSIDVLSTTYGRSQWVGLFNEAGTQGYGFQWNTNLITQYASQGTVSIRKFSVGQPSDLTFMKYGTSLTELTTSGHNPTNSTTPATSAPFAHFQLNWNAETNTLTLSVDGIPRASIVDASFTSFSRIFVAGNTDGLFDNCSVTTPGGVTVPLERTKLKH